MTVPNGDQCVCMSTLDKPVTQTEVTALNKASANGVGRPVLAEIGKASSTVKIMTSVANTVRAKRAGEFTEKIVNPVRSVSSAGRGAGRRLAVGTYDLASHPVRM